MNIPFRVSTHFEPDAAVFLTKWSSNSPTLFTEKHWHTDIKDLNSLCENPLVLVTRPSTMKDAIVYTRETMIVHVTMYRGDVHAEIAASSEETIAKELTYIKKVLTPSSTLDPNIVPVRFWMQSSMGPKSFTRPLSVPSWDKVTENYSQQTLTSLAKLMKATSAPDSGQLILWHGLPGTGKTYALRALIQAWQSWCKPFYIIDPDQFFSQGDYMVSVMMDHGSDETVSDSNVESDLWQLLILEDTGEMLSADAKERTGQALSRLLNLVDGMIGQGLKSLVLITTNEPLRTIHPAIARPGRCAAEVEFSKLSENEVNTWFTSHDIKKKAKGATLAELYGELGGWQGTSSTTLGFQTHANRSN